MYLPRTLPLCSPHLAVWSGESGKRYDFAVLRTGTAWIDEPAVYIFARHEDGGAKPLFVGETASLQLQFGGYRDRVSEAWRAAMANGMTHVHVRFDPTSIEIRTAEAHDLIAALHPMLNVMADDAADERLKDKEVSAAEALVAEAPVAAAVEAFAGDAEADRQIGEAAMAAKQTEKTVAGPGRDADTSTAPVLEPHAPTVRVPYRAGRLSPSRPSVELGEPVPVHWLDEPTMPLWQFRADPAGESVEGALPLTPAPLAVDPQNVPARAHDAILAHTGEAAADGMASDRREVITEIRIEEAVSEAPVVGEAIVTPAFETASALSEGAVATRFETVDAAPVTSSTPASNQGRGSLLSRLVRLVTGRGKAPAPSATDVAEVSDRSSADVRTTDRSPPPVLTETDGGNSAIPAVSMTEGTSEAASAMTSQGEVAWAEIREERTIEATADEGIEAHAVRFDVVDITHAEVVRIEDAGHDGAGAEIVRTEVTRAKVAEVEIRGSEVEQKEKATGAEAPVAETAAPVAAAVEAPAREATPSHAEQTLARLSVAKRALALEPTAPVVLFAGDIGWHGGADILFEAMLIVCAGHPGVQFVYAGDGALRGELQERASRVALGSRCRFLGDIPAERFGEFLDAADFVAIPARSPQGEDLALAMLAQGKPVLVTHQSGIGCVVHGRNGLVTYDNPGSFVWGVRELLGPLYGELLRQMDQMDRAA